MAAAKQETLQQQQQQQPQHQEADSRRNRWPSFLTSTERDLLALSTAVKVLLWPSYHSTDFEVHRNWLAITRTLPIREWYFEATSQWTLDYPPFFAYFSWILAQPAPLVDPLIVSLHEGLEYAAWPCKAYMRATVLVTELVLAAALVAHSRIGPQRLVKAAYPASPDDQHETRELLAASLFMHPGLIIIDHIHFQYNGFLFGVLLWSLWAAREDRPLLCAFLFSSLLNLKHIYMYIAPAYFVYLLRSYIYPPGSKPADLARSLERLLPLGAVTLTPFLLSLVPLVLDGVRHPAGPMQVLSQMISRLFPFSRGLIHAYWAPNVWALWAFADRILVKALQRSPSLLSRLPSSLQEQFHRSASSGFASASRGLVGHTSFAVMPDILPATCFLLTITSVLVYLLKLWQAPTYRSFLASISLCGFASFLFGWHVHEKAIMLVLVPYTLLAADDYSHFRTFLILSTAAIVSLFPLLYEVAETPVKIAYTLIWSVLVFGTLSKRVFRPVTNNLGILVHAAETAYLYGFVALQVYVSVVHPILFPAVACKEPAAVPSRAADAAAGAAGAAAAAAGGALSSVSARLSLDDAVPATLAWSSAAVPTPVADATAVDVIAPAELYPTGPDGELVESRVADAPSAGMTTIEVPETMTPQVQATADVDADGFSSAADLLGNSTAAARSHLGLEAETGSSTMEFLPLMLVSVYCAVGVVWAWLRASAIYLAREY